MVEKANKKHKKGFISEVDISSLLQRYTANTVLALLQEVAQSPGVKLDWNALVKKTSTGISNAREYQMLWRHLAYRNPLLEKLEDGASPLVVLGRSVTCSLILALLSSSIKANLDDDSDLEYELEAFPDVSSEASTEAAACVKVLIASGLPSDSNLPNRSTVEAPLTINIPNGQSFRASLENSQPACLMQGMNITVPVSVQKLPLPSATTTEGFDGNGSISGNMPPRKKRKPWTPEEDVELISAVQKCGEGNWANILKGDFKWDRTASQLSQTSLRCVELHEPDSILLSVVALGYGANCSCNCIIDSYPLSSSSVRMSGYHPVFPGNFSGMAFFLLLVLLIFTNVFQYLQRWNILRKKHSNVNLGANSSGSQLSEAQLAARHAMSLALDMPVKNITASSTTAGAPSNPTANNSVLPTSNAETLPVGSSSFVQAQGQSQQGPNQTKSSPVGSPGSAAKSRVPPKKIPIKTNFSTDSSLRAAAVAAGARIVTPSDAASLLKVAQGKNAIHIMPSGVSSIKPSITGGAPAHSEASPTVRYIRMGLAATSPNGASTSSASQPGFFKAASPRVQHNTSSEQTNAVICSPATALPLKPEVKAAEEIKVSDLSSVTVNEPSKEVQVDVATFEKPDLGLKDEEIISEDPNCSMKMEVVENDQVHVSGNQAEGNQNENVDNMIDSPMMDSLVKENENGSAVEDNCELQNPDKKPGTDECSGNLEVLSEIKASDEMQG
ncbi:hypothetical protein Patl1_08666 [Pistacia atlantica]|uniref:Uncharacterized protein n=1 Tax=Pistacia atlantica TaxID=434234 RepID=A0ACC1ACZ8_9ROSI|nr:hypothetical protein Patl1_08666 [Pistacia atlantica]